MGQSESVPGRGGEPEALGLLLERSLQGDVQALEVLVTLLRTRHYKRILNRLHHSRKAAGTQTLEDAFQDSVVQLVERVRAGELRDLPEKDRANVLDYFFRICDRRVHDLHRPRLSPVAAREKVEVPTDLVDPHAAIPGDGATTDRHLGLIRSAMLRLSPVEREVLERFLAGASHREIALGIGRSEEHVVKIIQWAKEQLIQDIAPRSVTAQLKYEAERKIPESRTPSAEEIRSAVDVLPPELREAIVMLHYKGKTIDDLSLKLGRHGEKKALVRVKQAYRILSTKLCADFPRAFQDIAP